MILPDVGNIYSYPALVDAVNIGDDQVNVKRIFSMELIRVSDRQNTTFNQHVVLWNEDQYFDDM